MSETQEMKEINFQLDYIFTYSGIYNVLLQTEPIASYAFKLNVKMDVNEFLQIKKLVEVDYR